MKKFVILISIPVLILAAALGFLAFSNSKPTVAFYKIDSSTQETILTYCNSIQSKKNFSAITLDPTQSLNSQKKVFKKSTVLFTQATLEIQDFAKDNQLQLPAELLNGYASSVIKNIPEQNGKLFYLPILYDFYLADINYELYSKSGLKQLNTFDDLKLFCKTQKDKPFTAALKNPDDFINILGSLSLSFISQEEYEQLLLEFYAAGKNRTLNEFTEKVCAENGVLYPVINELKQLIKENLISVESLKYEAANVISLLDRKNCSGAFETLSQHRKIDHKTVNAYTSIYIPSKEFTVNRTFAAPEVSAVCLKKNKKLALEIITKLSNAEQTGLSTKTGLSPVQKNCATADRQADDVRYWLAASNGPSLPLAYAFSNQADLKTTAEIIKTKLQN